MSKNLTYDDYFDLLTVLDSRRDWCLAMMSVETNSWDYWNKELKNAKILQEKILNKMRKMKKAY